MKNKIKRIERGWSGHFICGNRCQFHLNTLLIRGKTEVVVSTVGMMRDFLVPDGFNKNIFSEIGMNRYYETMAFFAKHGDEYHDIDVSRNIFFTSNWCIEHPYKDNEANEMHEKVVKELSKKIEKGELK